MTVRVFVGIAVLCAIVAVLGAACGKKSASAGVQKTSAADDGKFCARYCAKVKQCNKEGTHHEKVPTDCEQDCRRKMKDSRGRSILEPARNCFDKGCKEWTDCLIDEATKAAGAGS
jgi:hypothetical protein